MKIYKFITFFCLVLTSIFVTPLYSTDREQQTENIEEGFVTYATADYFPLLEVLLDSVKAFSHHSIVVFGINADVPFSSEKYPFMIKKRMDIHPLTKENIFFSKPRAILESGLVRGIYLDADTILNKDCDKLFEHCHTQYKLTLTPILPNELPIRVLDMMKPVMDLMGVARNSMPYLNASPLIFTEYSTDFIKEWLENNFIYGHLCPCHDETMLNILLWKNNAVDYLNICGPYYTIVKNYLNGNTRYPEPYKKWVGQINFYTFHGCKDGVVAKSILGALINKAK